LMIVDGEDNQTLKALGFGLVLIKDV